MAWVVTFIQYVIFKPMHLPMEYTRYSTHLIFHGKMQHMWHSLAACTWIASTRAIVHKTLQSVIVTVGNNHYIFCIWIALNHRPSPLTHFNSTGMKQLSPSSVRVLRAYSSEGPTVNGFPWNLPNNGILLLPIYWLFFKCTFFHAVQSPVSVV